MNTFANRIIGKSMAVVGRASLTACVLLAAGCAVSAEGVEGTEGIVDAENVAESEQPITGGWTTLSLLNGWQNYNTTEAPAIGVVNGVVRFRGALKGPNATSTCAFVLPSSFRSYYTVSGTQHTGVEYLRMRTVLNTSTGGSVWFEPDLFAGQSPTKNCIHINQDGQAGLGAAAKSFTSLDGVTFDRTTDDSTEITAFGDGWTPNLIANRRGGGGLFVKLVDGFVRFQGAFSGSSATGTFLFNLPSQFRPGQAVYVPVNLCSGTGQKYGRLNISSNGDVSVQGDFTAAKCSTSLEGASFSLASGGTTLTLLNNWVAYSPRAVKARVNGGVVQFEGAIRSGTTTTIATLPTTMRPSRTVYLTSDSFGATQGRIYVNSSGSVVVQYPTLSVADDFTSLDGLSFSF